MPKETTPKATVSNKATTEEPRRGIPAAKQGADPVKPEDQQESGGALTFEAVVDSVLPTGSGRDTFTVVLRPDENDAKFFRRASGRIELNDVRAEFGKQLQGKARATVTIAVTA